MPKTSIEWTDYSWPVVNGCRRKSAGCGTGRAGGCYAERLAATRLKHNDRYRGLAVMTEKGPQWTGEYRLVEKELTVPLRIRKPSRIFVADMGDLFYEAVPFEVIDRVFAVMLMATRHTYQILTKRPERMAEYIRAHRIVEINEAARRIRTERGERGGPVLSPSGHPWGGRVPWWLGTSVEDQDTADERIPHLLSAWLAPLFGPVPWVSYEPALGGVDFRAYVSCGLGKCRELREVGGDRCCPACGWSEEDQRTAPKLRWIVCGGESGPGARPFDLVWARVAIKHCAAASVPVFFKQAGARPRDSDRGYFPASEVRLRSRKGADLSELPPDLHVREYPEMPC